MFPAAAGLVVIIVSIVFRAFNLVDGWWIVDSLIVYFFDLWLFAIGYCLFYCFTNFKLDTSLPTVTLMKYIPD